MHLADLLSLRAVPAAGVSLGLTRRCPLSCAHCSTNSTFDSEEGPAELFTGFVDSFRPDDRPEVLAISGGEAFLRPALVRDLAERAGRVGCRATALSGMFWAGGRRIPPAIKRAIDALDHFSVSLDVFHEREVRREDVYRVLDTLLSEGRDVSIHLVGIDADDPYLAQRTAEVQRVFEGRVPMLVNSVASYGRAAQWLKPPSSAPSTSADPCTLATWPVVAFDGTVVACGNEEVVDGPVPAHLRLGHAATDGWPELRRRMLASSMLRAIRTFGPEYLAEHHGSGSIACDGYCSTCQRLPSAPGLVARVAAAMDRPSAGVLEQEVATLQRSFGAVPWTRRAGLPAYADLVTLGSP